MTTTWKLFSKCEGCKKRSFFIKNRNIMLPIGKVATSQKLLCGTCIRKLEKVLKLNKAV